MQEVYILSDNSSIPDQIKKVGLCERQKIFPNCQLICYI